MTRPAIVLLSGGMDSAVALLWAYERDYSCVDAITFLYGQRALDYEMRATLAIWQHTSKMSLHRKGDHTDYDSKEHHKIVKFPHYMFCSVSSIIGNADVDQYESVQEAIDNTPQDTSYIPLRNSIFVTIAAHHLLSKHPDGGDVIVGIRSRQDPDMPAGFPDCTHDFALKMSESLSEASGVEMNVVDPLNLYAPTREATIQYAMSTEYGKELLGLSVSCFKGTRCGKCLPCLRRAQAFEAVGIKDPADVK